MYRLTLEWSEGGQPRTQTISSSDRTIFPNSIRIGREDETQHEKQCDVVLKDTTNTVSRPHVGIYFEEGTNTFYLRNLTKDRQQPKQPNPAWVDGQKVIHEQVPIKVGSRIQLGKEMAIVVKEIELSRLQQQTPQATPSFAVKCTRPKDPHTLPLEYEGRNCPFCGYLVLNSTVIR